MPSSIDLCSLGDAHEAVASFSMSDFHMFFDAHHFRFEAVSRVSNDDVVGADGNIDWTAALRNVPEPVLAHELAHAMHIATTPAGLVDFFLPFLAEDLAGRAINDARKLVTDGLPRGLDDLFTKSGDRSAPYRQAKALEWYRAFRLGGVRFTLSNTMPLDRLAQRYPNRHFFARVDENGSTDVISARKDV